MRYAFVIINLCLSLCAFGQSQDSLLAVLNQPFEDQIAFSLDTMFKGQDTIFTETDSFILFTTPDMVRPEMDTVEFKVNPNNEAFQTANLNDDELEDIIGVVYLSDKRKDLPYSETAMQFLVIANGTEEGSFEVVYFEDIMPCNYCGPGKGEPDISILIKEEKVVEIVEVSQKGNYILNDEWIMTYENGELIVNKFIKARYHENSGNLLSETMDMTKMMQDNEFEPDGGEAEKYKIAVFPAAKSDITVDGKLDEQVWNREEKPASRPCHANTFGERHTRNDLFAKYAWAWDNQNLYLSMKVVDDKLVPLVVNDISVKGDYVKVYLDLNPYRMSAGKMRNKPNRFHLPLAVGFTRDGKPQLVPLKAGVKLSKSEVVFERTENGYDMELRLDRNDILSSLSKLSGDLKFKDGYSMDFLIEVGDCDYRQTLELENINASASAGMNDVYKYGRLDLYDEYRPRTFEELKKAMK